MSDPVVSNAQIATQCRTKCQCLFFVCTVNRHLLSVCLSICLSSPFCCFPDLLLIFYYWKAIGDKFFVIHHLAALYAYYYVLVSALLSNSRKRAGKIGGRRTKGEQLRPAALGNFFYYDFFFSRAVFSFFLSFFFFLFSQRPPPDVHEARSVFAGPAQEINPPRPRPRSEQTRQIAALTLMFFRSCPHRGFIFFFVLNICAFPHTFFWGVFNLRTILYFYMCLASSAPFCSSVSAPLTGLTRPLRFLVLSQYNAVSGANFILYGYISQYKNNWRHCVFTVNISISKVMDVDVLEPR